MQSEFVKINSNDYFVRTWGSPENPKILLLHGFPEHSNSWSKIAKYLKNSYYLIAPDQRGFGLSWAPVEEKYYRTSSITKDLKSLIEHYDDNVTVLGHDWGAATAYSLCFNYPKLVNNLIILNGVHPILFQKALLSGGKQTKASRYINFLRKDNAKEVLKENNFQKLIELFSKNMDISWLDEINKKQYITEWSRPGKLETMLNWYKASPILIPNKKNPETSKDLDNKKYDVTCPHLLIWGEKDTALLSESYQGLEEYCKELEIIKFKDADHWLHHQKPEEITTLIHQWLLKKYSNK